VDSVYARETEDFAAQGVGQDIANLIAYPILLLLAWAASRGSVRAYLAWLGILIYSGYSYAIYAFDVGFNALFLVYVAVLGLSIYDPSSRCSAPGGGFSGAARKHRCGWSTASPRALAC
jgi:hypothetical protein